MRRKTGAARKKSRPPEGHFGARAARRMPGELPSLLEGRGLVESLPAALVRGKGCRVWDEAGKEYIDYTMGWGSVILGHAAPSVTRAAAAQLKLGALQTLLHPLMVDVAELLEELVPGAECVRFGKNGSDATLLAARLARAVTGREVVVCTGYHGWHDWHAARMERDRGVPQAMKRCVVGFDLRDPDSLARALESRGGEVAAVMIDPRPASADDLRRARHLARRHGALFILDEILTGFRLAPGGAQERCGVHADLVCLGKAMANGFPLSALAGPRDIMRELDRGVMYSPTFEADPVALAAAKATLSMIRGKRVCARLWKTGERLQRDFARAAAREGLEVRLKGPAPCMELRVADETGRESAGLRRALTVELARRGVLTGPALLPSFAHKDRDLSRTLEALRGALRSSEVRSSQGTA